MSSTLDQISQGQASSEGRADSSWPNRVLILYAGSEEDRLTLRQALKDRGYDVDTFDELFGASQNLADDFV